MSEKYNSLPDSFGRQKYRIPRKRSEAPPLHPPDYVPSNYYVPPPSRPYGHEQSYQPPPPHYNPYAEKKVEKRNFRDEERYSPRRRERSRSPRRDYPKPKVKVKKKEEFPPPPPPVTKGYEIPDAERQFVDEFGPPPPKKRGRKSRRQRRKSSQRFNRKFNVRLFQTYIAKENYSQALDTYLPCHDDDDEKMRAFIITLQELSFVATVASMDFKALEPMFLELKTQIESDLGFSGVVGNEREIQEKLKTYEDLKNGECNPFELDRVMEDLKRRLIAQFDDMKVYLGMGNQSLSVEQMKAQVKKKKGRRGKSGKSHKHGNRKRKRSRKDDSKKFYPSKRSKFSTQ